MQIRLLEADDFDKGFLDLLRQLTFVPETTKEEFVARLREMDGVIVVAQDENGQLLGTAKLLLENKFHNAYAVLGHIEDVVVDSRRRGKGVGKLLVQHLVELARDQDRCYKICLATKPHNKSFYEKCGFAEQGLSMCIYTATKTN